MSAAFLALRRQLEELFPTPLRGSRGVVTGIDELDALLAGGGLPRGKLTEIRGHRSAGVTTVLRHIVTTVSQKSLVAYVDGGRTLGAGEFVGTRDSGLGARKSGKRETGNGSATRRRASRLAHPGSPIPDSRFPIPDNLWFIRPPLPTDAPWCADVLLRSGAFALVVLDGAPPLSRSTGARLIRLARETGTALVVAGEAGRGGVVGAAVRIAVGNRESGIGNRRREGIGDSGFGIGARARSSRQAGRAPHANSAAPNASSSIPTPRLVLTIEKGGIRRGIEVEYAIGLEDRLCAHPEVGDRRGAQPGSGKREAGSAGSGEWGLGIGAESEFGQRAGTGHRAPGTGSAEAEPRVARRASRAPAVPSPIPNPDSPLGFGPDRPRLRRRPRAAGVAGGDTSGRAGGDDGDGGPRVMRRTRGAAVG
jgi:hypothetical protein